MKGTKMYNKKTYLKELEQKLTTQKLRNEIEQFLIMASNKQKQKEFNDEMIRKTWYYQKKYGFNTNPRKGHEFWNVEADAFKHTFGSAQMYFKYGNLGSIVGGIYHENLTPNNPYNEWNMDSWNNDKGREIAQEIKKEYGINFYNIFKSCLFFYFLFYQLSANLNGFIYTIIKPKGRKKNALKLFCIHNYYFKSF